MAYREPYGQAKADWRSAGTLALACFSALGVASSQGVTLGYPIAAALAAYAALGPARLLSGPSVRSVARQARTLAAWASACAIVLAAAVALQNAGVIAIAWLGSALFLAVLAAIAVRSLAALAGASIRIAGLAARIPNALTLRLADAYAALRVSIG